MVLIFSFPLFHLSFFLSLSRLLENAFMPQQFHSIIIKRVADFVDFSLSFFPYTSNRRRISRLCGRRVLVDEASKWLVLVLAVVVVVAAFFPFVTEDMWPKLYNIFHFAVQCMLLRFGSFIFRVLYCSVGAIFSLDLVSFFIFFLRFFEIFSCHLLRSLFLRLSFLFASSSWTSVCVFLISRSARFVSSAMTNMNYRKFYTPHGHSSLSCSVCLALCVCWQFCLFLFVTPGCVILHAFVLCSVHLFYNKYVRA